MLITSPIDNYSVCKILTKISTKRVIEDYKIIFNIDVSLNFTDCEFIYLLECTKTNYRFYYPFELEGDGFFYKELEKIDWYYQKTKWEFDIAKNLIGKNKRVLEIGCGNGSFLESIYFENECIGIDINENNFRQEPFQIINTTLENYGNSSFVKFDWIISFQLLEHISSINSYFKSALKLLKQDGKILIVVPNNDAYFFKKVDFEFRNKNYLETLLLNSPPHHMGLWNKKSFVKLAEEYKFEIPEISYEPISEGRKNLNIELLKRKFRYKLLFKIFNNELVYSILSHFNRSLHFGDSIFIVLKKIK